MSAETFYLSDFVVYAPDFIVYARLIIHVQIVVSCVLGLTAESSAMKSIF